jgi:fused signal recognition particle receptor
MFKFLKDKLSKAVSIFSKKVEEEAEVKKEEVAEEPKRPQPKPATKVAPRAEPTPASKPEPEPEPEAEEEKEESREPENEEPHTTHAIITDELELPEEEDKEFLREVLPDIEVDEAKAAKKTAPAAALEDAKKDIAFQDIKEEEAKAFAELEEDIKEGKPVHEPRKEKKTFLQKLFGKKAKDEKKEDFYIPEIVEEKEERPEAAQTFAEAQSEKKLVFTEKPPRPLRSQGQEVEAETDKELAEQEKKGFFTKLKETLTTVKLSDEKFEKLFWDLELVMLENNVAVEVIEKIKEDLRKDLTTGKVSRKGIDELIHDSLKESVESLFAVKKVDLLREIITKKDKPYVMAFIGVNGSGKTTTMAKVASLLLKNRLSVVFAASDTFRAAAIQQLQEHADLLGIKMIRHDYESDPAAVAFDAVKHAKAKQIDVVLIDTAGRLHTNDNLMNELKKLIRVNKPDLKIFIGESITGNDCVEQAKLFNEAVGIDGIILAKADVDEKGGAAISVGFVTKKPILYLGTGQGYDDLEPFDPDVIIKNIGL